MAAKSLSYFLVLLFLNNRNVHAKLPEINDTNVQKPDFDQNGSRMNKKIDLNLNETRVNQKTDLNQNETRVNQKIDLNQNETGDDVRAHLKYKSVLDACNNKRDEICTTYDDPHICTMRIYKNNTQYKDFDNACYLFMSNMCDNPGEEFMIIQSGTCEEYLQSRRNNDNEQNVTQSVENADSVNNSSGIYTTLDILRAKTTPKTMKATYTYSISADGHSCPKTCPDTYDPQCINNNRYHGFYFKFMTFVNHCQAEMYFCKHPYEFEPPTVYDEWDVNFSGLSWSYCGASKFLQFARFSEVASSLGYYGWLQGNYGPRHIMKPQQRRPGYG